MNNGYGLRIFVLQIVREDNLVNVCELVPHGAAGRAADFIHDQLHAIFAENPVANSRSVLS